MSFPHCPQCDTPLPGGAPHGLCPRCLLGLAAIGEADRDAASDAETPSHLGDYQLLAEIAHGGMGIVYKARQVTINRVVALKTVLAGRLASPAVLERFRTEAEAAAQLDHPNIVPLYDAGEHGGLRYFTMKFVEGRTLGAALGGKPWKPRDAAALMVKVARAVHYAHQRGILHRDLKPGNILLDHAGEPHVTDFGLAKLVEHDGQLTQTHALIGTPSYMAPEQASGDDKRLTTSADIYSLGAILYEMLTGRPPFKAESQVELLRQVVEDEPVPPSKAAPEPIGSSIDKDIATICLKCLRKEPDRRYLSGEGLALDLERWLRRETIAARPSSNTEKLLRWCRRKPALAGMTALVIVSVLAALSIATSMYLQDRAALRRAVAAEQEQTRLRRAAEENEKRTRMEAEKSQQVAGFLEEMLTDIAPSVILGRDTTLLRDILDKTAERLASHLTNQPPVQAKLRNIIGTAYLDVGELEKAEALQKEALAAAKTAWGSQNTNIAAIQFNLAETLLSQDKYNEAAAAIREVLMIQKNALGSHSRTVALSLKEMSYILAWERKEAEAEQDGRRAVAILREIDQNETAELADCLENLGSVVGQRGRREEGIAILQESIAIWEKLGQTDGRGMASSLYSLGCQLKKLGRCDEAESFFRRSWSLWKKWYPADRGMSVAAAHRLAECLNEEKKDFELETLARQEVTNALASAANRQLKELSLWMSHLVSALSNQRKTNEVNRVYDELIPFVIARFGDRPELHSRLPPLYAQTRRWPEAGQHLLTAVDLDVTNEFCHAGIAVFLLAGDHDDYHRLRQGILSRCNEAVLPAVSDQLLRAALLVPGTGSELRQMAAWAAASRQSTSYLAQALFEYRAGSYSNAVYWSELACGAPPANGKWRAFADSAVLAMAHFRLNHFPAARKALARASELEKGRRFFPLDSSWIDVPNGEVLLREARALIEGKTGPAPAR